MWSQPYGPRMPFDGIGLKQSNGLVNPIERFEVARKWRFNFLKRSWEVESRVMASENESDREKK